MDFRLKIILNFTKVTTTNIVPTMKDTIASACLESFWRDILNSIGRYLKQKGTTKYINKGTRNIYKKRESFSLNEKTYITSRT